MLASDTMHIAVMEVDGAMVASATLIVAPNLLRGGRSHGFLENVAVHPDWQGKGNGRVIIRFLLDLAWGADCHHVLLQSGRRDPHVHRFYREVGFVVGLRAAYVAHRPT